MDLEGAPMQLSLSIPSSFLACARATTYVVADSSAVLFHWGSPCRHAAAVTTLAACSVTADGKGCGSHGLCSIYQR